jgi:hypothetical protein
MSNTKPASPLVEAGTYAYNSCKGKKERIGRLLQMHANDRQAGGLLRTSTRPTFNISFSSVCSACPYEHVCLSSRQYGESHSDLVRMLVLNDPPLRT